MRIEKFNLWEGRRGLKKRRVTDEPCREDKPDEPFESHGRGEYTCLLEGFLLPRDPTPLEG